MEKISKWEKSYVKNILYGAIAYSTGDAIGALILAEFSIYRLVSPHSTQMIGAHMKDIWIQKNI